MALWGERTFGLVGVLPSVLPAQHVVHHLLLQRRLGGHLLAVGITGLSASSVERAGAGGAAAEAPGMTHLALELEDVWAGPTEEAHVLLILRTQRA
jgi:hypothetical protein